MFLHFKPYTYRDLSTGQKPDVRWRWTLADHETLGAARSGLTECHLVTTGTPVSIVAIVE